MQADQLQQTAAEMFKGQLVAVQVDGRCEPGVITHIEGDNAAISQVTASLETPWQSLPVLCVACSPPTCM